MLKLQPADGQAGCTYYMTLLQSDNVSGQRQIHIGDFVYVAPPDLLLPSGDGWMKHTDQLSIYSVERLWRDSRSVFCPRSINKSINQSIFRVA